jgi:hypothetical protein
MKTNYETDKNGNVLSVTISADKTEPHYIYSSDKMTLNEFKKGICALYYSTKDKKVTMGEINFNDHEFNYIDFLLFHSKHDIYFPINGITVSEIFLNELKEHARKRGLTIENNQILGLSITIDNSIHMDDTVVDLRFHYKKTQKEMTEDCNKVDGE